MQTVVLAGLAAYVVAMVGVMAVRLRAAGAVRAANEPISGALPTGAELAERFLADRGLGVVRVVPADADAYRAATQELQLAGGRDERASAAAWAVAAHEVGHAALHRAGDRTWQLWWVLSGHGVWASVALPLLLIVQLFVDKPVPLLLAAPLAALLLTTAVLSSQAERRATATARELLTGAALPSEARMAAEALLPKLAAAYVAESLVDTTLVGAGTIPS